MRILALLSGLILVCSCGPDLPETVAIEYNKLPKKLDFNQHVKPILSDKCYLCHGPDKNNIKGGLQLHAAEVAYAELPENPGKVAIKPGNLEKSEFFHRMMTDDPKLIMPEPSSHLTLSDYEKAVLVKWIEDGAEYKDHWAFLKPENHEIPKVKNEGQVANEIDNFILEELEYQNLKLSDKADKETLLRRASLDLTGLPPTLEEIEAFVNDASPNAFEKQIDRLLASEKYGEQRTLDWMDLARYADTHGYSNDRFRDVSPWRDWVIEAFNENMPYDKFILWQMAGDMLPNATKEQKLATTFNRLHPQNLEGGIIDEEFRSEYVSDRTHVMGQGFLGLTMECAKCHDHKYDPISQKNYYEMYSFFNNVDETGLIPWDLATPVPAMLLPTEEQEKVIAYLETIVDETKENLDVVETKEKAKADKWLFSEGYKSIPSNRKPQNLVAEFNFDNGKLVNAVGGNGKNNVRMRQQFANNEPAIFKKGSKGKGLSMNGDTWLDLDKIGIYQRNQPFSIGIDVFIPKDLETGVIFHKMNSPELHSFRGYHLKLQDNKLEALLAHVYPDNAIVVESLEDMPKEKWVQLTMTYDGSSKASGVSIYMDGKKLKTKTQFDNLYKDIIFHGLRLYGKQSPKLEPGLRIGAVWRGKGIGGSVVDNLLVFNKELSGVEVMQIADSGTLDKLKKKSVDELSKEDKDRFVQYYLSANSKGYNKALRDLEKDRLALVDSIDNVKQIMVMKERETPRQAYILDRGQYDSPTDSVFPNTPDHIFGFPEDLPRNRIGLAQWITNPDNPLTARVTVNRYWQNIFGRGIVKTAEDFGNQGELPTHPKLLDWLAIKFVESGWDVKALHKLIMMSNTYQQSSLASNELMEIDGENKLLARGPAKRLSGEMLRDNALFASGLLSETIGGESVYPYQPPGLWRISGGTYTQGEGEELYRRSMYTIWRRTVPHPTIATFDAPTRDLCTTRRQETNTPLQALVLLNDPTFVEAARVLGKKMIAYDSLDEGISKTYKKLTGRSIKPEELKVLAELQKSEFEKFQTNNAKAKGWISIGEHKIDPEDDVALVAANAVVASTIINSDAFITKR
ncbi:PSD1 and planctomycete cytochrome C domain-containing protein [Seonamhaeicola marinus]|nr:PSD1 and planctomycete cytochrome C domain-containing protein [Seonamhaeicola marinus]